MRYRLNPQYPIALQNLEAIANPQQNPNVYPDPRFFVNVII
ncbi:hypothetical protein VB774_18440 [Pseudanabaena galeata UHCC 0370]|uniref:Uncharacterized protein n=1 Tax=Pseudanabaena galeata UHCC 0370 TaxID=3110310 RepID=A0ABU5TMP2_9CYAN|nr:hypothetical protein [Pseudanabaena galeata]MEA5479605.1 hypothetical protein [Pseudanabaena galeata UHCC 0370]